MSTHLKLIIAGAAALSVSSIAEACTCPPYPGAAQHAEEFDFVAYGHVENIYPLNDMGLADQLAWEQAFNEALYDYTLAREAGEDDRDIVQFEDDFYDANPMPPASFDNGGTITRISISRVLKGGETEQIYLHSAAPGSPTCGIGFRPDTDIVVLAYENDGIYGAAMCSIPVFSREEYEAALSEE